MKKLQFLGNMKKIVFSDIQPLAFITVRESTNYDVFMFNYTSCNFIDDATLSYLTAPSNFLVGKTHFFRKLKNNNNFFKELIWMQITIYMFLSISLGKKDLFIYFNEMDKIMKQLRLWILHCLARQ